MDQVNQELIERLNRVTEQAGLGNQYGGTEQSALILRALYDANPAQRNQILRFLGSALDDGLIREIADVLGNLMAEYIVDGRFGNGLAWLVGGGPTEMNVERFATNFFRATAILGPSQAIEMLRKWVAGEQVHYRRCAILTGVTVEQPLQTDEGLRFEKLPDSSDELERHIPMNTTSHVGSISLMGATKVSVECIAGPPFYRPGDKAHGVYRETGYGTLPEDPDLPSFREFFDRLCRALSLTLNNDVSWSMIWSECDESRIFGLADGGGAFSVPTTGSRVLSGPVLSQEQLDDFNPLLRCFLADLPTGKLGIAIDRWMASKGRPSLADRLIDLRIAMEALFLPEGARDELRFRLATNGALYLGHDFEERKGIRDTLRLVYDRASTVAHAGEVSDPGRTGELLAGAQKLCQQAILKRIEEGREPDWDLLMLG